MGHLFCVLSKVRQLVQEYLLYCCLSFSFFIRSIYFTLAYLCIIYTNQYSFWQFTTRQMNINDIEHYVIRVSVRHFLSCCISIYKKVKKQFVSCWVCQSHQRQIVSLEEVTKSFFFCFIRHWTFFSSVNEKISVAEVIACMFNTVYTYAHFLSSFLYKNRNTGQPLTAIYKGKWKRLLYEIFK